jgi:hypothetical protein
MEFREKLGLWWRDIGEGIGRRVQTQCGHWRFRCWLKRNRSRVDLIVKYWKDGSELGMWESVRSTELKRMCSGMKERGIVGQMQCTKKVGAVNHSGRWRKVYTLSNFVHYFAFIDWFYANHPLFQNKRYFYRRNILIEIVPDNYLHFVFFAWLRCHWISASESKFGPRERLGCQSWKPLRWTPRVFPCSLCVQITWCSGWHLSLAPPGVEVNQGSFFSPNPHPQVERPHILINREWKLSQESWEGSSDAELMAARNMNLREHTR